MWKVLLILLVALAAGGLGALAAGDAAQDEANEADFWAVALPPGKKVAVKLADEADELVHITQVALGPSARRGAHAVSVEMEGKRYYLGTLDKESNPHFSTSLMADDNFVLRHDGGSPVYVAGTYSEDGAAAKGQETAGGDGDDDDELEREFWGVEVKPGKKVRVKLDDADDVVLHITQVALGPNPKEGDATVLLEMDGKRWPIGTLSSSDNTEFTLDLPIDDTFTIRHTGPSAIYLTGYTETVEEDEEDDVDEDDDGDNDDADDEDEDGDGELEADFWGLEVLAGKKVKVKLDDEQDEIVHVRQIALGASPSAGPHTVEIEVHGQKYYLGTLDRDGDTEFKVDLAIDDSFTVRHTGSSPVFLLGYTGELEGVDDMQDLDGDGDDDQETEYEFWGVALPPGKKVKVKQNDADDVVTRITQVALGPSPASGAAVVWVDAGGAPTVIGTLSAKGETHFSCDLPIDDSFTMWHTGSSTVYMTGYTEVTEEDEDEQDSAPPQKGSGALVKETEFFGFELPAGKRVKVEQNDEDDVTAHITQIALGPGSKRSSTVSVEVNGRKIYLATLDKDSRPHLNLQLAIDDTFILRHTGDVSVYVAGYTEAMEPDNVDDSESDLDAGVRGGGDADIDESCDTGNEPEQEVVLGKDSKRKSKSA